jgi:hypothetical protein
MPEDLRANYLAVQHHKQARWFSYLLAHGKACL